LGTTSSSIAHKAAARVPRSSAGIMKASTMTGMSAL
jgi:hypothetical protein